jgi:hypothetical protein
MAFMALNLQRNHVQAFRLLSWEKFRTCFVAAMVTFFIAGVLISCAQSTSVTGSSHISSGDQPSLLILYFSSTRSRVLLKSRRWHCARLSFKSSLVVLRSGFLSFMTVHMKPINVCN